MASQTLRKRGSAKPLKTFSGSEKDAEYIPPPGHKSEGPASQYQYTIALLLVTIAAFYTRFRLIHVPSEVVFDEVHFGKFASYYLQRTYFFDLHPPFAKLLIAGMGYVMNYSGDFKFDNIGDSYIDNHVPYVGYRGLSAFLGSITIPVMFQTMKELGYSYPACLFAAVLVCFDNAHVAETRLILLDATLILSVALSIYSYVRFSRHRSAPFGRKWWKWLLLTGISLSCVISTKYVGVFTFFTIGLAVIHDLWNILDFKKGLAMTEVGKHFVARFFALIVVPFIIYLYWFWVHFSILTKSGPGDAFMSPDFQETLGDSPLAREAKQVNYHDVLTVKHKSTNAFLHSHLERYPLRYEDGRISSQGQQVTCVVTDEPIDDLNNHWEIVPTKEINKDVHNSYAVQHGDVVRFRHVATNGYLLTHDVASPLYPTNEEFTVIDPEIANGARFNDTLFKIDSYDKKKGGVVKTKGSLLRVIHVPTVVAMWTHNDKLLPDWGFHQQEVNGIKKVTEPDTIWYFDNIVNLQDERKLYVPKQIKQIPFLKKWWELQGLMFHHNNQLTSEHPFASQPGTWPLALNGVSFWNKNNERKQIFFTGNVIGFWIEVCLLSIYAGLVLADQLTRRRNIYALNDRSRSRLYNTLGFLFIGWCSHYLPFFLMNRQKFLHHYLPAHLIAALFSGGLLEFIFTKNDRLPEEKNEEESVKLKNYPPPVVHVGKMLVVVLFLSFIVFAVFAYFAPLTYGDRALTPAEVVSRQWLSIKLHFAK